MIGLVRVVLSLILALGCTELVYAQWHPAIQHTNVKLGSSDSIDLDTLSLQASFPVLDKAGRGAGTHIAISYHADFWAPGGLSPTGGWYSNSLYGWNFQPGSPLGSYNVNLISSNQCNNDPNDPLYQNVYGNRVYTDALGIAHSFVGTQTYSECSNSTTQDDFATWTTVDGYSTWEGYVYDPSGNQVAVGSGWNVDSNGNVPLSDSVLRDCSDQNTSAVFYCDTFGKPAIQITNMNFSGGLPAAGAPIIYSYRDTSGNPQTVTVYFAQFDIRTNFNAQTRLGGSITEFTKTGQLLPTSIVYSDGTYSISYESTPGYAGYTTARIASIQLPTGGTISYSYGSQAPSIYDGALPYLQRTTTRQAGNGQVNDVSTFTRTLAAPPDPYTEPYTETVTVQPASGNITTYAFARGDASGDVYIPTSITNGVTSQSICYTFSYTGAYNPSDGTCSQTGIGWPIIGRQATTTLDNSYVQVVKEGYNANGMLTNASVTDFGSNGQQQILSQTAISYASANSMVNRILSKIQYDGNGVQVAKTSYRYDEYDLTPTSNLWSRFPVFGDRGNLTTTTVWNSGSTGDVVTHAWYDDAGQVVKTQDASQNYVTYTRDVNDVYVTGVLYPSTASGIALTTSTIRDPFTGLVTSETDANQRTIRYSYDGSLRETSRTQDATSGMDGASVGHSYPASSQISTTAINGAGGTADVESFSDGYGRPIRSARKVTSTSGNPWVIADTCYDEDGRVSFKSVPYDAANYTGAQRCSSSGDSYQYDGIGRILRITHADGSYRQYSYKGRAVKITDEGNGTTSSSKVMQTDGLGRLSTVCEESSTSSLKGSVTSPTGCGTDLDGTSTGFLTTYAYNLATHMTSSSQSGQSRVWTTDSLGRPISETIPEAYSAMVNSPSTQGTTTYSYSYTNTGLQVIRSKPKANQSAASLKTATTTQYDQLGRPQSIQYRNSGTVDPDTPDLFFNYDTVAGSSALATNLLGRLTSVQSSNGVAFYGYTPEGRLSVKANSRPNGDCTYILQFFGYDLLGNVNTSSARMSSTGGTPSPNIFSVQNDFDATGTPLDIKAIWASGSATTLESNIAYSAHGIDSLNFDQLNGTGQFGHDPRGRATSFTAQSGSNMLYNYSVNWAGNNSVITSSDSVNGAGSYSYDEFNRLTNAVTGSSQTTYQYDVWGNRYPLNNGGGASANYMYDSHNHRTDTYGTYTYDAAGNMLTNGQTTSNFDAEGRVVRVYSVNSLPDASYTYGPEGDRVRAIRSSGDAEYVYASGSVLLTWLNGTLQKTQIAGALGHIGFVDNNNSFHYEFHDWNGSTRYRTNSGASPNTYMSGPFGETGASTGDAIQSNGLDWDSDSQAAHAGARDYYPNLGSWNSPDPFSGSYDTSNPQSFNRYAYVGNSPLSFGDSSGLERYNDAPEGSVFSSDGPTYDGSEEDQNSNNQVPNNIPGCQTGADDLCDFVRRGLDWLKDHFGGIQFGGGTSQYDDWSSLEHLAGGYMFNRPAGIVYAAQQTMTSGPPSLPAPTLPTDIVVIPKISGSPQDVDALSKGYSELMASPTARSDARAAALKPFPFQLNAVKNDAYFNPADGSVNVDPNFHPMTQTAAGPQPAPTSVIIGHEIGHRLGGRDDGPGNMNNVNKFENPIRHDLGIPDRIVY